MQFSAEKLISLVGPQGVTPETEREILQRVGVVRQMELNITDLAKVTMIELDTGWKTTQGNGVVDYVLFDREEGRVTFWESPIDRQTEWWEVPANDIKEAVFDGSLDRPQLVNWNSSEGLEVKRWDLGETSQYFDDEPFGEIAKCNEIVARILDNSP